GNLQGVPRAYGVFTPAAPAHHQLLLAIDPLDPIPVDGVALTPKQRVQVSIAEPPPLLDQAFTGHRRRPWPLAARAPWRRSAGVEGFAALDVRGVVYREPCLLPAP